MDKALRILDMYIRLCEGKIINKKEEAERFRVDERSIQRDIDEIRKYLSERIVTNPGDLRRVEYSREKKGFMMTGAKVSLMDKSEILAVIFSEYYFYLIANIVKKSKKTTYEKIYQYPAVYRIDRIMEYRELGETFRVDYANRFEEGEFRKRVQFMYQGKLMKIQFKYKGSNSEAILDRLPTARILSEKEGVKLIEAEVYGKGILMWLLSQGDMVEVIRPAVCIVFV